MIDGHQHDDIPDSRKAFAAAVILNAAYVILEASYGFATGSLALLADAAHNLIDVAGLLVAWGAAALAQRRPTTRHTYGLGRATVLAALFNGVAILAGVGAIAWEAVQRLGAPTSLPAGTVLWVAAVGIFVNAGTALLFLRDRHRDLNVQGAFLHMLGDTAVSAGVVLAALVIIATGWALVDPVVAILISGIVGWSAFGLLKSALHLSLDGVPEGIDPLEVETWLRSVPGISDVHDLHVWPLSTTSVALTAHLVMPGGPAGDGFLDTIAGDLEYRFGIAHSTLQVERGDGADCRLASAKRP
jgi:cobalt-zinc-cadmium efflux system protein